MLRRLDSPGMTLDAFLDRFQAVRKIGKNWSAQCPAHDDRSRNTLHIALGAEGRRLVVCRAGCQINEVLSAAKLKAADLFEDGTRRPPNAPRRRIQAGSLEAALLEVRRRERDAATVRTALFPSSDLIRATTREIAALRAQAAALGDGDEAWNAFELAAALEVDVLVIEAEQDAVMKELRRQ